jgi:hypothetical protein
MPRVADGPVQKVIHDVGECADVPRQLCPVIARHLDCFDIGRDGTPPVSFGGSRWSFFAASNQRHTAAKSAGHVAPVDLTGMSVRLSCLRFTLPIGPRSKQSRIAWRRIGDATVCPTTRTEGRFFQKG